MNLVQTTPNILFDDIEQFKNVIMIYGKHVFNSVIVNDDMLNFIFDNFVKTNFLQDGQILGSIPVTNFDILVADASTNPKSKIMLDAVIRQRDICKKFYEIFIINFNDPYMKIPSSRASPLSFGTYGALFPYTEKGVNIDTKLVKYASVANNTGGRNYKLDISSNDEDNYTYMLEFCTFVVIMSLLIFIDCNLIIDDDDRNICIADKYKNVFKRTNTVKNYFLSYCSFFAIIDRPFIKNIKNNEYIVGYVVFKYEETLHDKFATAQLKDIPVCLNLFTQTINILQKLFYLSNLGIILSHRDITTNNIMYTPDLFGNDQYKIRLIDFGFMCLNVTFKDGTNIVIGNHPFENKNNMNMCDKNYIDIILFLVWCIRNDDDKEFLNMVSGIVNIDIVDIITSLVTFNESELKDVLEEKEAFTDIYEVNSWQYAANIDSYIEKYIKWGLLNESNRITNEKIINIFDTLHTTINDINDRINNNVAFNKPIKPSITQPDYGDIKLFDISNDPQSNSDPMSRLDKFMDLYEKNKYSYLQL